MVMESGKCLLILFTKSFPVSNLMKYKKGYLPTMMSSSIVFFKKIAPKILYCISINFLQSTCYYLILISFL